MLFENFDISIITDQKYNEQYLFKASNIGKMLKLTNIFQSIKTYKEEEEYVKIGESIFLTSQGLHHLLIVQKKKFLKSLLNGLII